MTLQTAVSPAVAGTVQFREGATLVGTVALAAGAGQPMLANVPAGDHTYTASFVPADDLRKAPSTSAPRPRPCWRPRPRPLWAPRPVPPGHPDRDRDSGAGSPAGSVEFREGTTLLATAPVSAGTATRSCRTSPPASHAYTATFVPSVPTSFAGSVSSVHTATVARPPRPPP